MRVDVTGTAHDGIPTQHIVWYVCNMLPDGTVRVDRPLIDPRPATPEEIPMIERDPLPKWSQPVAIEDWGRSCSPPIEKAWLNHLNYFVHPDAVVAASRLLLPKFVDHEGGVSCPTFFHAISFTLFR